MRPNLTAMAVILTSTAALVLTLGTALAATPTSAAGQPSAIFASSVTTQQCISGGGAVRNDANGNPACFGGVYDRQQVVNASSGGGYG